MESGIKSEEVQDVRSLEREEENAYLKGKSNVINKLKSLTQQMKGQKMVGKSAIDYSTKVDDKYLDILKVKPTLDHDLEKLETLPGVSNASSGGK